MTWLRKNFLTVLIFVAAFGWPVAIYVPLHAAINTRRESEIAFCGRVNVIRANQKTILTILTQRGSIFVVRPGKQSKLDANNRLVQKALSETYQRNCQKVIP